MTAIVPVLLTLIGGAVLRRSMLKSGEFWSGLERLTYYVLGPALFVTSIGNADLGAIDVGPLLLTTTVPIIAATGVLVAARPLLRSSGPALGSIVQGAIRINTYIGLVFINALHGELGIATFAIACAISVPVVNLLCVSTLTIYGAHDEARPRPKLLREIATNPLILSCLVGLTLSITNLELPTAIASTLDLAASSALLCGTLIAGASISFTWRRRDLIEVTVPTLIKLAVLPLAAASLAITLGADQLTLHAIVILTAVPTAPSAAILSAKLGGDTRLMATIIGVQTLLSTASMPLMLELISELR
ncbi:AEC family transporter [Pseudoclavibacter sp. RFBJ3]|uniref:AEC family transporter n=1 Tax=unclassified Pseudoclavibacter TaxID=2615177 RepID=UPI000CE86C00|nr:MULTISPECIES: AEC family transporter [unclassified Pseudoclavibacter]PPF87514.1 AEC family transporter [Pseudoclavibacter sp. RFBJ5]PPF90364.1 AEC family transporter [Pseudoclavibacter sp. RFBJ3]PPG01049.1 AEC family transporter [Pseudoclavibacter sp. RFBH5]PPG26152.1 AEC family transporter [Pseudoclavibacter sp. RFBI4]PPG28637.1 AEC family transporter [Pseudoclavibacter sp. RFBG4]